MADLITIANQFVKFYYSTFDSDRSALRQLYAASSDMTWEGSSFLGVDKIMSKSTITCGNSLDTPFYDFLAQLYKVLTFDAQPLPTNPTGSIVILVTGLLIVDGSSTPLQFSQTFILEANEGSYFVSNDIFRLNYGT